ncbi:MAG TPA: PBP1A family penicillin-binding protein [Longimicrobiales bacterium]
MHEEPMPNISAWISRLPSPREHPRITATAVIVLLSLCALGGGLALGSWRHVCHDCPSIAQIHVWEPTQSTKIFSHDGILIDELGQERRTQVALEALPPYVPQAFIAIEDRRFYEHHGFDLRGIARAVVGLIVNRRISGGGSTITQQLARNMFVQVGIEQSFSRKLKELKVALDMEQVYTKEQILEAYINQINYGRGHYGIESAAQWMFGKPATAIEPHEAALLAAVINLPEAYSPFKHPERALRRRNLVLELMARQGFLSRAEAERYKEAPLPEEPQTNDAGDLAPYFVEWIRGMLDDRYGSDLYRRGFRVYTTLDVEIQRRAVAAMEAGWKYIESQPTFDHPTYAEAQEKGAADAAGETPYLQGMFIAMEPETGEVRAMIGGRDFDDSKFNRATQARRQPGSVFKPFVYTAAIASRIPASHIIFDAPYVEEIGDTVWAPRNFSGSFAGPVTLREALRRSINVVAVKLGKEVGIETVAQYARRMGIETEIPRVPSTAIGAASVIPIQILEAYSVFPNYGVRVRPRGILRVEDADGNILWQTKAERDTVLDPLTAAIMTDMLRDVVDHGTAYSAIRGRPDNPILPPEIAAAGKTGTTNDFTDVWFVGFTPDLLAAVWFGFDRPTMILPNATGGGHAAPVWGRFMRSIYVSDDSLPPLRPLPEPWVMPEELRAVAIDSETGKLATEWCPMDQSRVYVEYFLPGTQPTEACELDPGGLFGAPIRGFGPPRDVVGPALPNAPAPVLRTSPDTTTARGALEPAPIRRDTLPSDTLQPAH